MTSRLETLLYLRPCDLQKMRRPELDQLAVRVGLEDPSEYSSKADLASAILGDGVVACRTYGGGTWPLRERLVEAFADEFPGLDIVEGAKAISARLVPPYGGGWPGELLDWAENRARALAAEVELHRRDAARAWLAEAIRFAVPDLGAALAVQGRAELLEAAKQVLAELEGGVFADVIQAEVVRVEKGSGHGQLFLDIGRTTINLAIEPRRVGVWGAYIGGLARLRIEPLVTMEEDTGEGRAEDGEVAA